MARMLPENPHADIPGSEEKIFKKLKNDPGSEDWTVIHSLGLTSRGHKKPYGEIDFVVVVPGQGIICLEVKGGTVKCNDGKWTTTNNKGTFELKRSPFMQAREGMFALRKDMNDNFGVNDALNKAFIGYAVVFPDVDSPPKTPEFEPDEVIDIGVLGKNISDTLHGIIKSQRRRLANISNPSLNDPADVSRLVKFLRPSFELKILRGTRIRRDHEQLVQLTGEQIRYLNISSFNKRCLVKGPAGTGKTFLALQTAQREASSEAKTGFFCFNNVYGGWLRRELKDKSIPVSYAGGIYSCLLSLIDQAGLYSDLQAERKQLSASEGGLYFKKLIPRFSEMAILKLGNELDFLILDETQDILQPELLGVFDIWLRGGIKGGRWAFFGDFERQALYSEEQGNENWQKFLDSFKTDYFVFPLTLNCRNTQRIAEATALFSGFEELPYHLNQITGDSVDASYWKTDQELKEKLVNKIRELLAENVKASDISILSPYKFENSSAQAVVAAGHLVCDISGKDDMVPGKDQITYSTIHSFKGMESQAVILTDTDDLSSYKAQALLYTGMSRAISYLCCFFKESLRAELKEKMKKSLTKE